jgi:DNA polymerase III sliding clamp (beta) subunit (PCNA family)
VPVLAERDYLDFAWPQGLEMQRHSKKEFSRTLRRCIGAADKENDDRPERSIIHFNGRHVVSSDGFVMACQDGGGYVVPEDFNLSMTHAGRLLRAVDSIDADEIHYAFKYGTLHVMSGRLAMLVTGVATSFPTYEVVLRSHAPALRFVIGRKRLLDEVTRLVAVSDKREQNMTMTIRRKGITLHGVFGGSEIETSVECDIVVPDEEMVVGFTVNHLFRGIKTLVADEVTVEVVSPARPVCFR